MTPSLRVVIVRRWPGAQHLKRRKPHGQSMKKVLAVVKGELGQKQRT